MTAPSGPEIDGSAGYSGLGGNGAEGSNGTGEAGAGGAPGFEVGIPSLLSNVISSNKDSRIEAFISDVGVETGAPPDISTPSGDVSEIVARYSGPNGTGTLLSKLVDYTDGRSSITKGYTSGNSRTTVYSGPYGTGSVISIAGPSTPELAGTMLTMDKDTYPNVAASGDVNRFDVALTAGVTYWFNAEGSSTSRGTISDPYLRLLGTDGVTQLAFDQGSGVGLNSFISYTPTKSGTYQIEAGSSGSSTGSYFLTERTADDYPTNPATNGTLPANGSVAGSYDFVADTDWFRTTLAAGTTYHFDAKSTPIGPGTQIHPMLWLYGNDGVTQVASDLSAPQSGAYEASLNYTPTVSGAYYVSVGSYGTNVGTYNLSEATVSGATPSSAANSRMSFITGGDGASTTVVASPGTAIAASQPAGDTATRALADPSAGAIPPDQFFASAGSTTQIQYTAGDGIQQPAASLMIATTGYTTSSIPVISYLPT